MTAPMPKKPIPKVEHSSGVGHSIRDGWNWGIGFGLAMTIAIPLILIFLSCIVGLVVAVFGLGVFA